MITDRVCFRVVEVSSENLADPQQVHILQTQQSDEGLSSSHSDEI